MIFVLVRWGGRIHRAAPAGSPPDRAQAARGRFVDWRQLRPRAGAQGTCRIIQEVIALLGWELDVDKQVSAATETQVLGVLAQVQETHQGWTLRFSIPETKLAKWLAQIVTLLAKGRLSSINNTTS